MLTTATVEPEMSRTEFEVIRDFLHERCGIFFADNKMYLLKNRLARRMACLGIRSYRDYFYQVKYDSSLKEFNALLNLVTTNETSFFRNEPQLKTFSDEILPALMKDKRERGDNSLRIWSAGCSTGEEPYTLATLVLDKLGSLKDWDVEITANDISEDVLKTARVAEYSGATLRNVPPACLARHFDRLPGSETYRLNSGPKSLVRFSQINLNDPRQTARCTNMDIIFCRNVMIYFSEEVKKLVVRGYYNALRPGGYFFVGHSETLHGVSKAFKLVYFKNALVYQKEAMTNASTGTRQPAMGEKDRPNTAVDRAVGPGSARAIDLLSKIKPAAAEQSLT